MSTSLRFRSRQGGEQVEDSSARRWQTAIDTLLCRIRGGFSHYTPHLLILAVAIAVFVLRPVPLQLEYDLPLPAPPTAAPALGYRSSDRSLSGRGGGPREYLDMEEFPSAEPVASQPATPFQGLMTADLQQAPVFHTTVPKRLRREVITYVVEPGDHVGKIAIRFDLEPETVMWANGSLSQNPDLLRPG